jgi:hypothetical protein
VRSLRPATALRFVKFPKLRELLDPNPERRSFLLRQLLRFGHFAQIPAPAEPAARAL